MNTVLDVICIDVYLMAVCSLFRKISLTEIFLFIMQREISSYREREYIEYIEYIYVYIYVYIVYIYACMHV